MLRNRLLLCSELTKPEICDLTFILRSSSHASWFHHLDLSLSFCHLFPPHLPPPEFMPSSVSPGSQQHLSWVFVLFCCFTSTHAPLLSSFIHLQITLPKVCLQDRAHILYCVSFLGQSILSPPSQSNNSYKTFWYLLTLMNLPDFPRPLHLGQSCFSAWKSSPFLCYHWDLA